MARNKCVTCRLAAFFSRKRVTQHEKAREAHAVRSVPIRMHPGNGRKKTNNGPKKTPATSTEGARINTRNRREAIFSWSSGSFFFASFKGFYRSIDLGAAGFSGVDSGSLLWAPFSSCCLARVLFRCVSYRFWRRVLGATLWDPLPLAGWFANEQLSVSLSR